MSKPDMSTSLIAQFPPEGHISTPREAIDSDLAHRKPCTLCNTRRPVLVRCQIDSSGIWHFVCPGACWRGVSGGEIDGDGSAEHRYYKYGGMWKNKHEGASTKKPKKRKDKKDPRDALVLNEGAAVQDEIQGQV